MTPLPLRLRPSGGRGTSSAVVLAAVAGVALSAAIFLLARALESQKVHADFESVAGDRAAAVADEFEDQLWKLEALRSFWRGSDSVERHEFEAYARPLLRAKGLPEVLAFAEAVPAAELADHEARVRATLPEYRVRELAPDGGYRPVGERELHAPLVYVEPEAYRESLLGLDLAREPIRRATLERARATGMPQCTPPLRLTFSGGDAEGILMVVPILARGEQGRDGLLTGFACGAFRLAALMDWPLSRLAPEPIGVHLIAGADDAPPRMLHSWQGSAEPVGSLADVRAAPLRLERSFTVGGREWLVLCTAPPGYMAQQRGALPWWILALGLVATGMQALFLARREIQSQALREANERLSSTSAQREEAVARLAESEARFRGMFERHDSVMLLIDHASGAIVDANRAAERYYGWTRDELRAKRVTEINQASADDVADALERAQQEQTSYFVFTHRLASGELRRVEVHSTPIDYEGRRLLFSILHDVTDREEVQRKLLETQKLESLGVLAGGIAHDFNNLLTSILGNVGLALRELPAEARARGFLQSALRASERAADLTRQLLAYAGKGSVERRAIDLSEHIRETTHLLRTAVTHQVELKLELAPGLPAVLGDPAQIQQVLMNLVLNGVEACGEGPGTVRVETGLSELSAAEARAAGAPVPAAGGRYVRVDVRDDGCGMDADTLARIFDPFFTTKFAGRGLGLAAVLGIVRAHGGWMEVVSQPGAGSRFRMLLPASDGVGAAPDEEQGEPSRGEGLILVIDDEPVVRDVAASMLRTFGYSVLEAADGRSGVLLLERNAREVRLVLLDMTMPGMGGEETFQALRAVRPDLQVLLSSGHDESEATRRFVGKGLAGFVQKPYTPARLAAKVRELLGGHRTPGGPVRGG